MGSNKKSQRTEKTLLKDNTGVRQTDMISVTCEWGRTGSGSLWSGSVLFSPWWSWLGLLVACRSSPTGSPGDYNLRRPNTATSRTTVDSTRYELRERRKRRDRWVVSSLFLFYSILRAERMCLCWALNLHACFFLTLLWHRCMTRQFLSSVMFSHVIWDTYIF